MNIRVTSKKIKDVWDIQRATHVLRMVGLSSDGVKGLTHEDKKELEKQITLYCWKKIKEQFPQIEKFCKDKTGGFNKPDERHFNTPIINIYGSFYLQLISLNNKNNWCWESIDLEPYRFEFNEEGYFKSLVVNAINKSITRGYQTKEKFKPLIDALNEEKTHETFLTIKTKGKNLGKIDIHKTKTSIR